MSADKVAPASSSSKATTKRRTGGGEKRVFAPYLYAMLKEDHPGLSVTSGAMATLESFVAATAQRLAEETCRSAAYNKRRLVTSRDAKAATKLLFAPCGDLDDHALAAGVRATESYQRSVASPASSSSDATVAAAPK